MKYEIQYSTPDYYLVDENGEDVAKGTREEIQSYS